MQLTHFFLVEISSPQAPGAELCQAATQASAAAAEPLTLTRIAWNAELQTAYVYLQLAQAAPTGAGTAPLQPGMGLGGGSAPPAASAAPLPCCRRRTRRRSALLPVCGAPPE